MSVGSGRTVLPYILVAAWGVGCLCLKVLASNVFRWAAVSGIRGVFLHLMFVIGVKG